MGLRQYGREKNVFTLLAAGVKKGSLKVTAMRNLLPGLRATIITAERMRFREGMVIENVVSVKGKPDDLVATDPGKPKVAELTPPAPFEGSARFELTSPKTSTWSGDLAIELPGFGSTQLAGKSFESTLCQRSRCTNTAPGTTGDVAELVASLFG